MFRSESGFSLLGLILVVAILGTLTAVALPRFAADDGDARVAGAPAPATCAAAQTAGRPAGASDPSGC